VRASGSGIRAAMTIAIIALSILAPASAAEGDDDGGKLPPYTEAGADTCLKCHDETSRFPVLSIFKTPHAVMADDRTPFAGKQCEACHGPGGDHAKRVRFGKKRPPPPAFGPHSPWGVEKENAVCLSCHRQDKARLAWHGGVHQREGVACVDCHRIHARRDPVRVTSEQPGVCYDCHQKQRAEMHRAYAHPVREGRMACSDCHQPHGSLTEAMLDRPTINETCYTCHAEKRGPFLWEHAPVTEDCTLCHQPHGSNNPALLTRRPPFLCQQCHSRAGHPSIGRTTDALPSGMPSGFLLGGSCTNCHSQVHGSNHPSGANLSR